MSILKVYDKGDPGPNGALTVTGDRDPDDPSIERAHTFARVDNPPSDPIPVVDQGPSDVAETVTIYNVLAVTAGTEYSQALSADAKWVLLKCRQNATVQIGLNVGDSGTNFITIPSGSAYTMDKMSLSAQTLYFQANVSGVTVEMMEGS